MITFFHISYNLTGKWNFDIKCALAQFNLIILSRVIEYMTYRQTDTFVKTTFSDSGGLKT